MVAKSDIFGDYFNHRKKRKLHKNVQNPCPVVTFFYLHDSNISNNRANANFLVFILSLHNVDSGSEHEGRSIEVSVHVSKISYDSNLTGLSLVCAASVEHTRDQVIFRLTEVAGRIFWTNWRATDFSKQCLKMSS